MSECKGDINWLLFQWHSHKEFYSLDILNTPIVEQGQLLMLIHSRQTRKSLAAFPANSDTLQESTACLTSFVMAADFPFSENLLAIKIS